MSELSPALEEAQRWLRYAQEDLELATWLMETDQFSPRHICLHSQQAAEKALKAAIVLEEMDPPFIHDLDTLRNLLPDGWTVKETHDDLVELSEWVVESRYPGDWSEPTHDDAAAAIALARSIYESIAAEFRKRGAIAD